MSLGAAALKLTIPRLVIPILWAGFILWTFRKVWRSPEDPAGARFYGGVKLWSVFVTGGSAFLLPTILVLPALSYWPAVIFWAVISLPLTMWAAYFGSRWIQAIVERHHL